MRVLISHSGLTNQNNKYYKLIQNLLNPVISQINIISDIYEDYEIFSTALQTRDYSIIISDKRFLKTEYNSIKFYTNTIIIDEDITAREKSELYKKGVNLIIDLSKNSEQEVFELFNSQKSIQISKTEQLFNIKLNLEKRIIINNGVIDKLIKGKMFDIFVFLIFNLEITFSKEEIINACFKDPIEVNENSIDTYLSTLKRIINENFSKIRMNVINKEGYNLSIVNSLIKEQKTKKNLEKGK